MLTIQQNQCFNLRRKYFFTQFLLLFLFSTQILIAQDQAEIECSNNYSFLVLEDKSGQIIFEKKSDQKIYPASLTKLMTVYLTFKALKEKKLALDQILTVSDRAEDVATVNKTNTLKLKSGEKISVKDAIKASIVKSFNETTIMLAEAVAGSEWKFVPMMNKEAKDLGMAHTNFRNASGLYDDGQFTTDYDLARLAIALKEDFPEYYHFFALKEFSYNGVKYKSHNNVLLEYKGAEGMKTGFTVKSGYNLISIAKRNNKRVISVLTSCSSYQKRDALTKQLLDKAFEKILKNKDEKELKVKFANNWNKEEEAVEKEITLDNVKPAKSYILKIKDKKNAEEKQE